MANGGSVVPLLAAVTGTPTKNWFPGPWPCGTTTAKI